jgi:hypothetical protein
MPNVISHVSFRRGFDLWADRTRLPELDQEVIKIQPPFTIFFSNSLSEVSITASWGQVRRYVNPGLKISVFGRYGSECHDDPPNVPISGPKNHTLEFRRCREVNKSRSQLAWKQK